ncbi:oligosaccharide flippase family protein [Psychrosphaera ytuae]|uniref:Oligosaccharide flippase family protein n=1 Tax=Psychrosphaera ytuae TaxID=2820710 RepID=A0A975D9L4_9GAMM|nr:oligosaccharide flippase family protein [Psychrosphaera ytuae]QTH63125.1 oligosaccharide flippase family protein [Psychrosphaera ytuae]
MSSANILLNSYKWVIVARWIGRFAGIISTLILVRILSPDDYGIAAQALFVLMLFDALSHTGTEQFVIKQKEVSDSCLFTAWTLNLILKSTVGLCLFIFSSSIASFMNEPRLDAVLQWTSLIAILDSLRSPALIIRKRNMDFRTISTIDISSKLLTVIFTITMGFILRDYWALVFANIFSSFLIVMISYFVAPSNLKLTLENVKAQFKFARGIFVTSVIGYIRAKLDILIISKKFGSSATGHYSIGQEFSILPYTEAIAPLTQPLYSSLAKIQDDSAKLKNHLFKYLGLSYSLVVPAALGIFLLADQIVLILFGEQWVETTPVLAYLSFLMITFVTNGAYKIIFTLKSKFWSIGLLDLIGIILVSLAFLLESLVTLEDFAVYRTVVGILVLSLSIVIAKLYINYEINLVLRALLIPVVASFIMGALILLLQSPVSSAIGVPLFSLLAIVFISAIGYFLIWLALSFALRNKHYIWEFGFQFAVAQFKSAIKKVKGIWLPTL